MNTTTSGMKHYESIMDKAAAKVRSGVVSLESYEKVCDQRDALQTELGNTQFALEAMAEQRDAALAALREIQFKPDLSIGQAADIARAAIAAAESEGQ